MTFTIKVVWFFASALLLLMNGGCSLNFDEGGGYYVGSYAGDPADATEDLLLVSGSGETLVLEYNTLSFTALLNWKDGNYYFAPDPDGTISGNKIICAATVSSSEVEGDCFRDRQVCHFSFYETWSDLEDKEAYSLSDSSCKTAASVGPFLVPLDAPICGDDPFPACPDEDLFPEGPGGIGDPRDGEEGIDEVPAVSAGPEAMNQLINALCQAALRCDETLQEYRCIGVMNQYWEEGATVSLADEFGLGTADLTSEEIRLKIGRGEIQVDETALTGCLSEFNGTCDNEGEAVAISNYQEIQQLVPRDGTCPAVLSMTDPIP